MANSRGPARIGVLSDTHGYLDPAIGPLFQGVERILHAGDIGLPWIILELQQIAPVTAVSGNNDHRLAFREAEMIEHAGRKFILRHIVDPHRLPRPLERQVIRENPDVVVFGHTHRRHCEIIGQTLYFNPGYAGKPRFGLARSVAILTCDSTGITSDFYELG